MPTDNYWEYGVMENANWGSLSSMCKAINERGISGNGVHDIHRQ